ncbi:DNA-protecting protein DprA [Streptomyces sp. AJS327]|uniref:DNA-processing protein DprA n=1 Tax=Streptomyces sp. AJS327 TaxID=2545265 RepID=UPI0015DFE24D|nr:DNA-processing protein DprA [Streptomyces sp. AJS327]MBA0051823.1 DNA-protecting protein DprA [Streptomyces sp. AJS327]
MTEPEHLARAALTRITEPGDALVGRWLTERGAEAVLHALTHRHTPLPGATTRRWAGLRLRAETARPEADLASIEALNGRFVCPGDTEWPRQLDDLGNTRPIGLWIRGTPSLRLWALRSVALVGARACTDYGARTASLLGAELAERGWTVVSGVASGIDGAAHRGALAAGGPTVGVLASGVDVAYPKGHAQLVQRLAHEGLLLAELAPGDHPTRSRFVLRNRVIAALTRGTIVVEAALRSGSLATARHARELDRHTMGVPGPVSSSLSAGVHGLLRGEATLVTDADEVIELVGEIGELAPERRGPTLPRDALPPEAARVLEALPVAEPIALSTLAHAAAVPPNVALARLHELRALGFVKPEGAFWKLTGPTTGHPIG